MYEIIVLIIVWILLPLFLIPYSLVLRSKNHKLKDQLKMYEQKFGPNDNLENNCIPVHPQVIAAYPENKTVYSHRSPESEDECSIQKPHEPRSINISVLLIIGVILVILAGLIFATTSWSDMSNLVRTLTVLSGSVFFFAVSVLSEKKLRLETTAKAFYILGCFFLPVSVVAIAYFKMFGKWFSFTGNGADIVFMAIFFISSVAAAAGVYKYHFRTFAVISMASFSLGLFSLVAYSHSSVTVTVVLAAYSFILMSVKLKETEKTIWLSPYLKVIKTFARINVIGLGLISLNYAFYVPPFHNQLGYAAFAVLFLMAGTASTVFRSENRSVKYIVNFILACEYIFFAALSVGQIAKITDLSDNLLSSIFSSMFIPAFVLFRFVPRTKSRSSEILMIMTELICVAVSDDTCKFPAFILLAFLSACAVSEKENIFKGIYAAVLPASVFITLRSFDMSSLNCAYTYISLLSSVAVIAALFSEKSDILKKLSCSSYIYVIVITPVIVAFTQTDKYTDLLLISSAALIAASVYSVLNKEGYYISVPVTALSLHVQFYGFMKLIDSEIFDSDTTGLYFISVIVTIVIILSGLLVSRRYKLIGSQFIRSSALFVSLVLLNDFPEYKGSWRFIFALCYAVIIAANGYISTDKCVKKIMFSIAAGLVSVSLMVQNFIDIPQIINAEYYVGASLFIHVFLHRIWKENREEYSHVLFVHSGLSILTLMICAIESNKPEDAIILASICSVIVIGSYILKSRRWLYLGGISLIVLVVYITRDFWLSIAWWVYLLTAGIVFISFAGINEYCKVTGKENLILKKIKSIMDKKK